MKPELVVFGTSPLVSAELHTAIRRLFGDTYPVREALTEDAAGEFWTGSVACLFY